MKQLASFLAAKAIIASGVVPSLIGGGAALAEPIREPTLKGTITDELSWAKRWTGPYWGASLGASRLEAAVERGPGRGEREVVETVGSLGLFAGYNFLTAPTTARSGWVAGVEFEAAGFGDDKAVVDANLGDVILKGGVVGSVRLRAGYAWERIFVFGSAGVALTNIRVDGDSANEAKRFGLTLGVGADYALTDNWIARLEGVTYAFPDQKVQFNNVNRNVGLGASSLRLGLAYKF